MLKEIMGTEQNQEVLKKQFITRRILGAGIYSATLAINLMLVIDRTEAANNAESPTGVKTVNTESHMKAKAVTSTGGLAAKSKAVTSTAGEPPIKAKAVTSTAGEPPIKAKAVTSTAGEPPNKAKAVTSTAGDAAILERARRNKQIFEDEESIKDYTTYLSAHPGDEKVRGERAEELRNEHRYDEYTADLNILIKSKDKNVASSAASDLGKLYQKQGKYAEAIKTFKYARSLGVSTLLTEMSDCARSSGDYATALQVANEIIKQGDVFEGKRHRAETLLKMNKPREALDDLNQLTRDQKKYIASVDKESRAIFPAIRRLLLVLADRAQCYDALKETKLAQADRAEIRTYEQEAYNETPFLTKDKR
ncbi:MAG TPA: hypothetical protein V6C89_01860 [Drouetiella sp.]|jgi:tetratricopeptide (TPR) repeat protein